MDSQSADERRVSDLAVEISEGEALSEERAQVVRIQKCKVKGSRMQMRDDRLSCFGSSARYFVDGCT